MRNGTFMSDGRANRKPANNGAIAAPVVRATPVMPAVADRTSGRTTAIVYDCLVGTSIWLMLKRRKSSNVASVRLGMSGTTMSRMFEGRCVKNHGIDKAESRSEPGRQQCGSPRQ